jgi:hypothetical protein
MERGWLEAGKGGPYVPRRHPAECGGPLSGRGFGPGGWRQCEFCTGLLFMLDDLMGRCPSGGGHGVSAGGTTC